MWLAYTVALSMQAEYLMKVQVIRSKRRPPRFFVNVPLPLAAALDLSAGEQVQWQLLDRSDLRLKRISPPRPLKKPKS
jgi:hypothetical protein